MERLEDRTVPSTGVLIKDINPATLASDPQNLTSVGNLIYFSADDGIHGRELWRTDGTSEGTVLVADSRPGSSGSQLSNFAAVNDTLFFVATTVPEGAELWMSDGTAAGTVMVKDIFPGGIGSVPKNLVALNGKLYFTASGPQGNELWVSNGTAEGTTMVQDIVPGPGSSVPVELTVVGNLIYFAALSGVRRQIFVTDGTELGTSPVTDLATTGTTTPRNLAFVNDTLYFAAYEQASGEELYAYVPGVGANLVSDINPGTASSTPRELVDCNGTLFFVTDDASAGRALFRSDGTASGTVMIEDIAPTSPSYGPSQLTAIGDSVYFVGNDYFHGGELWVSDGTEVGTYMVSDIVPRETWGSSPMSFTELNGWVYFYAGVPGPDALDGVALWRTDGTEQGTTIIQWALTAGSELLRHDTSLYCVLDGGPGGNELWRSDGSAWGTQLLKDINSDSQASSDPTFLTDSNGSTYFMASAPGRGPELWISDGTVLGTRLVADIIPGPNGSHPRPLATVDGVFYFYPFVTPPNFSVYTPLWRTDGTPEGTVPVEDIMPGYNQQLELYGDAVGFQHRLFFILSDYHDSSGPVELMVSDGTPEGTGVFVDLNAGRSVVSNLTVSGDWLYFVARSDAYGTEVFRTDGTAAGTTVVMDTNATDYSGLTDVNGTLFYWAYTAPGIYDLWKTDGTPEGTSLLLHTQSPNQVVSWSPFSFNGKLYFLDGSESGCDLWVSDGTPAGTTVVYAFPGGTIEAQPIFAGAGGGFYFIINDGVHGQEIWRSDGTTAGTRLVKDISPGTAGTGVSWLVALDEHLYFAAWPTGAPNYTLWQSDGTADGTFSCWSGSPYPYYGPAVVSGTLIFAANVASTGQELYRLDRDPVTRADSSTCIEDADTLIDVLTNDSDPENDPFAITGVSVPANGSAVLQPDSRIMYTPAADFNGSDTFTYTVTDSYGNTSTATVTVLVAAVNDAPVISAPVIGGLDEDAALLFTTLNGNALVLNDVDAADALCWISLSVTAGTLTLAGTSGLSFTVGDGIGNATMEFQGSLSAVNAALEGLTFAPPPDYFGPAIIQISINDQGHSGAGTPLEATASIAINVAAVNDPPVAMGETYAMNEDSVLLILGQGVLGNDQDVEDDLLAAVLVSGPTSGMLSLDPRGWFLFVPNPNFFGQVTFTYKVNDGEDDSEVVTVTIDVANVPDAPVGGADGFSVDEDGTLTGALPDSILTNDVDPDGGPLTATLFLNVAHGTLTLNDDGSFTYVPHPDYHGPDAFFYIPNGSLPGNPTLVSINVVSQNDAPVGENDAFTLPGGEATALAVLVNDSDVDGDNLSVQSVTQGLYGTVTIVGTSVTYLPNPGFAGTDSFTYTVFDGVTTATATVTVTVLPAVNFEITASETPERRSKIRLIVTLTSPVARPLFVDFSAIGGTATEDEDYRLLGGGTLSFKPNKLASKLRLRLLHDQLVEADETVLLRLSDTSSGTMLGSKNEHTLTIPDNDVVTVQSRMRESTTPTDVLFSSIYDVWQPRKRRV